ncbi:MAG TPA: hypothetical protein VJN18_16150 [Polyangiaceae bacterium]|nr:hypothetical protein [Polyangiaceae bacterium]
MNLKKRTTALIAMAALAVPVVAYAGGKYKSIKESEVTVRGKATPGPIPWDLSAKNAVTIVDDGTTIKLKLDGHKLDSMIPGRQGHTMKYVFHKGETGKEKRTIEVAVTHEALNKALASKASTVKATAQFSNGPVVPIDITGLSVSSETAKGVIKVSREKLGITEKICIETLKICVEDQLTIEAEITYSK